MLSVCLPICLWVVSTAKDSTGSKGLPEFSPELFSKMWSLSCTTLSGRPNYLTEPLKNICIAYLALNSPTPKVHAVKIVYLVKQSTQVKIVLQPFAHKGSPVIKSIDHDPNLLSATGNDSSKPGGA